MEFPSLGRKCAWPLCKTLDFLPFTCNYCNQVFCKDHFNGDAHNCRSSQNEIRNVISSESFICSIKDCSTYSANEMLCAKCHKHFCLIHRYHDCYDTVTNIEEKKKLWNEPKEQFAQSVKNAQNAIDEKIKKAIKDPKKQATALKIQLMRIKAKAQGSSAIPVADRVYFLIILPKGTTKTAKPIFVNQDWSVGRVIDAASDICNVINKNNELNSPKIRLFKKSNGLQVSTDTSIKIINLLNSQIIANGESLILEYVPLNENLNDFVLKNFSEYDDCL